VKIRSKSGEIIDLDDIRKEQVYIGNPYAVEVAILIRHNTALLDALEGALRIEPLKSITANSYGEPMECTAYNDAISDVRIAIGYVEENPA
jgi:hypothetical protein